MKNLSSCCRWNAEFNVYNFVKNDQAKFNPMHLIHRITSIEIYIYFQSKFIINIKILFINYLLKNSINQKKMMLNFKSI